MQDRLLKKWGISKEELKTAVNELCSKGIGNGCYPNTNALLACLDLLSQGNIEEDGK